MDAASCSSGVDGVDGSSRALLHGRGDDVATSRLAVTRGGCTRRLAANAASAWTLFQQTQQGRAFCHNRVEQWLSPGERVCMAGAARALLGASLAETRARLQAGVAAAASRSWRCDCCTLRWPLGVARCSVCNVDRVLPPVTADMTRQTIRSKRRCSGLTLPGGKRVCWVEGDQTGATGSGQSAAGMEHHRAIDAHYRWGLEFINRKAWSSIGLAEHSANEKKRRCSGLFCPSGKR